MFDASGIEVVDIYDIPENVPENLRNVCTQTNMVARAVHTQTDETHNTILTPEPSFSQVRRCFDFSEAFFADEDEKVKFYTGLASFEILLTVFSFVEPHVDRRPVALSKFQELAMVLVKLRLAVPHQDLAYRLGISCAVVSRIA